MASLVLFELVFKTLESMIAKGKFSGPFMHVTYLHLFQFKSMEIHSKYTNGMGAYKIFLGKGIYLSVEA